MRGFAAPVVVSFFVVTAALAVPQRPDIVIMDGVVYALAENSSSSEKLPLELLWENSETRPRLSSTRGGAPDTGPSKGYVAIWEVSDRALYLRGLDAWQGNARADLKMIFPQNYKDGKVKAEWFSGALTLNTTESPQLEPEVPKVTLHFKNGNLPREDGTSPQVQPPGPHIPPSALGSSRVDWYSRQLTALQEPSLYAMRTERAAEVYRFLWLRTFHHPVAVRVVCKEDGDMIVCKMCAGAGGYEPGRLMLNRSASFSPHQKTQLKALLESSRFWELPSKDTSFGLDGSHWIVEAVKDGRYHIVDRWSPESGAVRDLGLFFIKAGNFIEEKIY